MKNYSYKNIHVVQKWISNANAKTYLTILFASCVFRLRTIILSLFFIPREDMVASGEDS